MEHPKYCLDWISPPSANISTVRALARELLEAGDSLNSFQAFFVAERIKEWAALKGATEHGHGARITPPVDNVSHPTPNTEKN
jgi:glutamine synthetase type III